MIREVGTTKFKKDFANVEKQNKDMSKLQDVIDKLKDGQVLESKYKDHFLTGNYLGCRECHIEPNWLLIYKLDKEKELLHLVRTGSHSKLFKEQLTIVQKLNMQLDEFLK